MRVARWLVCLALVACGASEEDKQRKLDECLAIGHHILDECAARGIDPHNICQNPNHPEFQAACDAARKCDAEYESM
jgi:hypothetical protein